jgi:hypothetical protein
MTATLERSSMSTTPDLEGVFDAVSDAHRCSGFDAGYRRAANDLLAELALVIAEVGRERPEARAGLRDLRHRFEQLVDGQATVGGSITDGYVDGGLGI